MNQATKEYLAEIGRRGGKNSKRKLSKRDAREMAEKRWGQKSAKKVPNKPPANVD